MPSPRDLLGYMRVVGRGSPVDPPWSVAGQVLTVARKGNAAPASPLTLEDVMASADYRDLMTAKVAEGDLAPGFRAPADRRARLAAALVGTDGRIAFQGGEGPFGFKPAELERAILRLDM